MPTLRFIMKSGADFTVPVQDWEIKLAKLPPQPGIEETSITNLKWTGADGVRLVHISLTDITALIELPDAEEGQ